MHVTAKDRTLTAGHDAEFAAEDWPQARGACRGKSGHVELTDLKILQAMDELNSIA